MNIYSDDFNKMTWDEFSSLVSGLGPDTPLARTVLIRTESDPDMLQNFTPAQHRLRNEWRSKHTVKRSKEELQSFLGEMQATFASM